MKNKLRNGWENVGCLWKSEKGGLRGRVFGKYVYIFVNPEKANKKHPDFIVWFNKKANKDVNKRKEKEEVVNEDVGGIVEEEVRLDVPF